MVVVGLGWLFTRTGQWLSVWPQAAAAAQATTVFLAPTSAAAAAIAAGRAHGPGVAELTAHVPRPRSQPQLAQLAASLLYGLTSFLVVTVVALCSPWLKGVPSSSLWLGYTVLGLVCMIAGTALGHWTGLLLTGPAAPALAAVTMFAALGVIPSDSPYNLTVISGSPEYQIAPAALAIRALLAAGLLVAAVGWPQTRPRWGYLPIAPSLGITTMVIAAVALGPIGFPQVKRAPLTQPLCSATTPQVCVWPENQSSLTKAAEAGQQVAKAAAGVLPVPPRFYETGLQPNREAQAHGFSMRGGIEATTDDMISEVLPHPPVCTDSFTTQQMSQFADAYQNLSAWLFARATGPGTVSGDVPGAVHRILRQNAPEQTTWAREQAATIQSIQCPD
ncbi:hypothetical protein GCM10018784_74150 [Streptomyces hydrogenans]|nr:hypothetical protein GCM10018784_74150 [Streptomyces hydrogenans]